MENGEVVRNPWQWELKVNLIFANGDSIGGAVFSPFCNYNAALAWRNEFLGLLETRCKILGIKIRYKEDEITCVEGGAESLDEDFNSTRRASDFLAQLLRNWIEVVNMEFPEEMPQSGQLFLPAP